MLIAATRLRKGECFALRWDADVLNLADGWLKVRKTLGRVGEELVFSEPKTPRARRIVPLSPAVVTMLRRQRTAQKAERLRMGDQWHDSGPVFTQSSAGQSIRATCCASSRLAAESAGVEGVGMHTLRRSVGVGWLESGVHIKAVADRPGHSSISVTGDIYRHPPTLRGAVLSTVGAGPSGYEQTAVMATTPSSREAFAAPTCSGYAGRVAM